MNIKIVNNLSKYQLIGFCLFLVGYVFALSSSTKNLIIITSSLTPEYFALANVIYFIFILIILKVLLKTYKYFEIKKEFSSSKKIINISKMMFIGYFLGSFTLLGNVFIEVLYMNFLK